MPNLPISGLPVASSLSGTELYAVVQGGVTKQSSLDEIKNYTTASIYGVNSGYGWARYDDTTYTTSSFFSVADGNTVILPNNGGNSIESYMNSPQSYYNPITKKVQMQNVGDVYQMVITFKAKAPNANQTHIDLSLSSTGTTPYDRVSKSLNFAKGNNVWENFYESFHFYADSDFVTNGNQWTITADGGQVDLGGVIYFIQKTFNAG